MNTIKLSEDGKALEILIVSKYNLPLEGLEYGVMVHAMNQLFERMDLLPEVRTDLMKQFEKAITSSLPS